jgi:NAD(P)-dependent dehydrogenase (short-subunit alcohol dehydrogenase family)
MGTILITGTSSGLGLLTAIELARRGERVFASMRDVSKAEMLRAAAQAAGVTVEVVALDVRGMDSIRSAVRHVLAEAGTIDVVVNNSAVSAIGPLEFASECDVVNIFDTNVVGPIRVIQAVLPAMRTQRSGRIVNVSSGAAHSRAGVRLLSLYAASKAALHTLTLEINKELAPLGIQAILVEGGVGGKSRINDYILKQTDNLARLESPYVIAERIAAVQMRETNRFLSDGHAASKMIADACTINQPAMRFPADAQKSLDWLKRLSDDDYMKLCALQDVETVLKRNGLLQSAWKFIG